MIENSSNVCVREIEIEKVYRYGCVRKREDAIKLDNPLLRIRVC